MPDTELAVIKSSTQSAHRADVVLEQILSIKSSLMKRSLELGRLLREARDNDYALQWGYPRFGDWVEDGSGLDMSARSAYYLIGVVEMGEKLCIGDEDLEKVKLSKLKAIAGLKDDEMSDEQKTELILNAQTMTLADVQEVVGIAKQQEWTIRTYKFDKTGYENGIAPTIERIKREYGDTVGEDGQRADISDSKAVEICFADYAAGPEFESEYDVIDGTFEDVLEITEEVGA